MLVKICLVCKNEFSILPYRKDTAHFCSRKCYHKWWSENVVKRFAGWNKGKKCDWGWKSGLKLKGRPSWNKGEHFSETSKKKMSLAHIGKRTGAENNNYKGGIYHKPDGRILIKFLGHPFLSKNGYIARSRLIAEHFLGRYLKSSEIIHHIDEDPTNDRAENLYLFSSRSGHNGYHAKKDKPILVSNII